MGFQRNSCVSLLPTLPPCKPESQQHIKLGTFSSHTFLSPVTVQQGVFGGEGVCLVTTSNQRDYWGRPLSYGPFDYRAEQDTLLDDLLNAEGKNTFFPAYISDQHSGPKSEATLQKCDCRLYLKIWQRYIQITSPVKQNPKNVKIAETRLIPHK